MEWQDVLLFANLNTSLFMASARSVPGIFERQRTLRANPFEFWFWAADGWAGEFGDYIGQLIPAVRGFYGLLNDE
ncbi:unnamed protein product, partial [Mesorhabditis spiculigera]